MGRTKGNIIELFIDKAVLAIAAIIALIILLTFVLGSPNSADFQGEKVSPGKINETIRQETEELRRKLQEKPQESNSYASQTSIYLALVKNSVKIANENIHFPLPGSSEGPAIGERTYHLPKIGQIAKPAIGVVTMAAFIPVDELTDEVAYDKAETKLEDIDLVTVACSINSKQLYEDFRTAFAGKNIPLEQREEQYGKPVFAKVELQRRMLLKDGSWSQWTETPKIRTCRPKKTLLPAKVDDYSTQIALEQFAKTEIRDEVLQPPAYDNAIPAEKWICPPYYNERQKRLEKEKEELKKQQLEAEKARRLQERAAPRRGTTVRQPSPAGQPKPPSGDEGVIELPPSASPQSQPKRPTRVAPVQPMQPRQPVQRKPSAPVAADNRRPVKAEEQSFDEICLSEKTTPAELEKLVFWAHDDTAIPGEKYQYRIRIGVLNPIAGKPWFSEDQKDLQDQMVLFSSFSESDPNKPVEIPQHLYFFATDSKEKETGKTTDKTVDIKVARWTMGNWITQTFNIRAGDQIGTTIDVAGTKLEKAAIPSETIDLSTGAIMVDTMLVTGLTATGRIGDFYELLYYKVGGEAIERMPIKERYWPEEIVKAYKEISESEASEAVVLLTRNEAQTGASRSRSISPEALPEPETETTTPFEMRLSNPKTQVPR